MITLAFSGKVNFCTGTGRKAFFRFFFGLILDPPPVHMLLQRKKGEFICTGQFFPHCMAFFLEKKRGGLVPVYVFLFPVFFTTEAAIKIKHFRREDHSQERKISPKRKLSGRISRGHPGVICADIPAQNFGQGPQNPGKKTIIWARTSMTP